jgi:hypothetical protein
MADGPYPLDFLQTIINVQFGGDYLAIFPGGQTTDTGLPSFAVQASINGGSSLNFNFTYTDPFDGSAGSISMSGGPAVRAVPFTQQPTILASDLTKTLLAGATASVSGFGFSQLGTINTFASGVWFIKISAFPANIPILINSQTLGAFAAYSITLFSYKQSQIKAGVQIGTLIPVDTVTIPPGVSKLTSLNKQSLKFSR